MVFQLFARAPHERKDPSEAKCKDRNGQQRCNATSTAHNTEADDESFPRVFVFLPASVLISLLEAALLLYADFFALYKLPAYPTSTTGNTMMNSGYDDEFAPNPFRSSNENDFLGAANPPQQQQQQRDPYSGMTGTLGPSTPQQPPMPPQQTSPDPSLWSGAMDQRGAAVESYGGGGAAPGPGGEISSTPFSVFSWRSWVACFQLDAYKQYFDVDTVDVADRLKASLFKFYQPDQFRTAVVGDFPTETLKGPDLYGPVWIMMTLVFVLAATSNIYFFWEHAKNKRAADDETTVEEFEVDIHHLVHASNVVVFFVLGVASAFWLAASCMGMPGISWGLWVCCYGYAQMPIMVAAFFIALIPIRLVTWILLGSSVGASALLILRNLSTPLLSQDVSLCSDPVVPFLSIPCLTLFSSAHPSI